MPRKTKKEKLKLHTYQYHAPSTKGPEIKPMAVTNHPEREYIKKDLSKTMLYATIGITFEIILAITNR